MPMSFIMSKNLEHSSEKTPRELERFTNLTHLYFLLISLIKFRYFSFLRTAVLLRLDSKQYIIHDDNKRMWGLKTTKVPEIMGALGTIKTDMENYSKKIPGNINVHDLPPKNSPFYSPPSQAGPLHQVETLFASQSPWFGLGC